MPEEPWEYVDSSRIIVYGAIDPKTNILEKIKGLMDRVRSLDAGDFRNPLARLRLLANL